MSDIENNTENTDSDDIEITVPRLKYSGMTDAAKNDGTAATDTNLDGEGPTGRETAVAADVLGDHDKADRLGLLQPGSAAASTPDAP